MINFFSLADAQLSTAKPANG